MAIVRNQTNSFEQLDTSIQSYELLCQKPRTDELLGELIPLCISIINCLDQLKKSTLFSELSDEKIKQYEQVEKSIAQEFVIFRKKLILDLTNRMISLNRSDMEQEFYESELQAIKKSVGVCKMFSCLNMSDEAGMSPLAIACDMSDIRLIDLLLDAGANPNHLTDEKLLPLVYLIENQGKNIYQVVAHLLARGADLRCAERPSASPLVAAARFDDLDLIDYLMEKWRKTMSPSTAEIDDKIFVEMLRAASTEGLFTVVKHLIAKKYPKIASIQQADNDDFEPISTAGLVMWCFEYSIHPDMIIQMLPYLYSNPVGDDVADWIEVAQLDQMKQFFDRVFSIIPDQFFPVCSNQNKSDISEYCDELVELVNHMDFEELYHCYTNPKQSKALKDLLYAVYTDGKVADQRVVGIGIFIMKILARVDELYCVLSHQIQEKNSFVFSPELHQALKKFLKLCMAISDILQVKWHQNLNVFAAKYKDKLKKSEALVEDIFQKTQKQARIQAEAIARLEKEKQKMLIIQKQKQQDKLNRQLAAQYLQEQKKAEQALKQKVSDPQQTVSSSSSDSTSQADKVAPQDVVEQKKNKSAAKKKAKKQKKRAALSAAAKESQQSAVVVPTEIEHVPVSAVSSSDQSVSQSYQLANEQVKPLPVITVTRAHEQGASALQQVAPHVNEKHEIEKMRIQLDQLWRSIDELKQEKAKQEVVAIQPQYNITKIIGRLPSVYESVFAKLAPIGTKYMVGGAVISLIQFACRDASALASLNDFDIVGECRDATVTLPEFKKTKMQHLFRCKSRESTGFDVDFYHVDHFDMITDAARRDFYCSQVYLDQHGNIYDPSPEQKGLEDIRLKRLRLMSQDSGYLLEHPLCLLRAIKFMAKGWSLDLHLAFQIKEWSLAKMNTGEMLAFRSNLTKLYNGLGGVSAQSFWHALEQFNLGYLIGYVIPENSLEWRAQRLLKVLKLIAQGWQDGAELIAADSALDFSDLTPDAMCRFSRKLTKLYLGEAGIDQASFIQVLDQCHLRHLVRYTRPPVMAYALGQPGLFQPIRHLEAPLEDPEPGRRSPAVTGYHL